MAGKLTSESINLNKLSIGTTMQHVNVRLMRMWEARNFKRNGELMSLELLLLDSKDCLIQASIHHRRISQYKQFLTEGQVYTINRFEVIPAYDRYRVADNINSIRLTDNTKVAEEEDARSPIKEEFFRILTYTEYAALANTNLQLPDVVGQILSIQGFNLQDPTSTQKIVVLLLLREGTTVRITIWDEQALDFRKNYLLSGGECMVNTQLKLQIYPSQPSTIMKINDSYYISNSIYEYFL